MNLYMAIVGNHLVLFLSDMLFCYNKYFGGGPPHRRTKFLPSQANQTQIPTQPKRTDGRKKQKWGAGWRCNCNSRSCEAVVEKTGHRPPVAARLHTTTPGEEWAAAGAVRRGLQFTMWPRMCHVHPGQRQWGSILICFYINFTMFCGYVHIAGTCFAHLQARRSSCTLYGISSLHV